MHEQLSESYHNLKVDSVLSLNQNKVVLNKSKRPRTENSESLKSKFIWMSKNTSCKKLRKLKKALGYKTKLRNNYFKSRNSIYNGHACDAFDDQTDTNDDVSLFMF